MLSLRRREDSASRTETLGDFFQGKEVSKTIFGRQWPRLRHNLGYWVISCALGTGRPENPSGTNKIRLLRNLGLFVEQPETRRFAGNGKKI